MFYVEMVRRGPGGVILVTLRDGDNKPSIGDRLRDEAGVVWAVLGHTTSEIAVSGMMSMAEFPKGMKLVGIATTAQQMGRQILNA